ncbi:catabolite control protein A [Dolosigranulum pigrum]
MATVSRVVNGNPNVKPSTRKKVFAVIDELNYRPNAVARGLASKKTTTVGVLIPDVTNLYYSALARGIDDIATMYKYNIILANSDENEQKEVKVLNTLLAKQVDGVIYMGTKITDELRDEFERSRTPVVLAGTVDPQKELASVNIDYGKALKQSVDLLVKNGNKNIAFVYKSDEENVNDALRLAAYREALEENGLTYNEDYVIQEANSYKNGQAVYDRLANLDATAAVFSDDELAVGFLNVAINNGLKVPEDFEIVTSNNSKLAKLSRPELSTVVQPLYDIGAVAMRLLTKLMNKEDDISDKHVVLPYHIDNKGTTK